MPQGCLHTLCSILEQLRLDLLSKQTQEGPPLLLSSPRAELLALPCLELLTGHELVPFFTQQPERSCYPRSQIMSPLCSELLEASTLLGVNATVFVRVYPGLGLSLSPPSPPHLRPLVFCYSPPCPLSSSRTAFSYCPTSGPLHWLLPLPGTSFLGDVPMACFDPPSSLCSSVIFSVSSPRNPAFKSQPAPPPF